MTKYYLIKNLDEDNLKAGVIDTSVSKEDYVELTEEELKDIHNKIGKVLE